MRELRTCPKCETVFRVSRKQLRVADGALRCGSCFSIFHASSDIEEAAVQDIEGTSGVIQGSESIAEQDQLINKKSQDKGDYLELNKVYGKINKNSKLAESYDLLLRSKSNAETTVSWYVVCTLLILFGILQYLFFNFERYAADPNYRIYAAQLCAFFGCHLADFSDPESLALGGLSIRSDPDNRNALIVNAIVKNSAAFRQKFPGIKLEFYDLTGASMAKAVAGTSEFCCCMAR